MTFSDLNIEGVHWYIFNKYSLWGGFDVKKKDDFMISNTFVKHDNLNVKIGKILRC